MDQHTYESTWSELRDTYVNKSIVCEMDLVTTTSLHVKGRFTPIALNLVTLMPLLKSECM